MRRRPLLVVGVALVTLGSGLLNLYSVMGPSLPERSRLLRRFFPLEFVRLSRFFTLLIGFALVISSLNIYKRKKRAWQIVLGLGCLSVLFHLTKGLDYGEALLSAVLVGTLLAGRRHFTVKSRSIPDLGSVASHIAIALLVVLVYGVLGFWLLDPREFGVRFTLAGSIHRTLRFLLLAADPEIVPHTRYARWFLDSLYVVTIASCVYAGVALFRPAVYLLATLPQERTLAAEIVSRYGRCALDYFKFWQDKSFFFTSSQKCFLAYRVGADFAVVLADPVGPEDEIETTILEFKEFCEENDWGLAFYQTLPDFLSVYKRVGFKKLKIGDDAIVDLTRFTLQGKAMKKFRHVTNQLESSGITMIRYEPPVPDNILAQAREVSDEWLQIPGRRERTFSLGLFEASYIRSTPLFCAVDPKGSMLAFVNELPSYYPGEATADLMRHRLNSPNGIMDYLFVKIFLHNKEKGFKRFNLGMAPMAGFQEKEEASAEEKAVHYFFQQLNFLFSFSGLRRYKAKFATSWEPRYAMYRNVLDLPRLALALRKISELKNE